MNADFQQMMMAWLEKHVQPVLQQDQSLTGLRYTLEPSSMLACLSEAGDLLAPDCTRLVLLVSEPSEAAHHERMATRLQEAQIAEGLAFEIQPVAVSGNHQFLTV